MHSILAALAKRMKEFRKKKGFSQEAFADHAGLHRVAVGWIEQGRRVPSLTTLVKISRGFALLNEPEQCVENDHRIDDPGVDPQAQHQLGEPGGEQHVD